MIGLLKKFVNSTIGTANAVALNDMHGKAVFRSNGVFTVPTGISTIFITACAAGDNGFGSSASVAGAGGAAGAFVLDAPVSVSPGENVNVVVGVGNTTVKDIILIKGAGSLGGAAGACAATGTAGGLGIIPFPGAGIAGAVAGPGYASTYSPGGGGGIGFCVGGNGGGGCYINSSAGPGGDLAYSAGKPGNGPGCGGGGAGRVVSGAGLGGAGAPGIVIIEW